MVQRRGLQMLLVPALFAISPAAGAGLPNQATIELYLNNLSLDQYAPRQGVNTAVGHSDCP